MSYSYSDENVKSRFLIEDNTTDNDEEDDISVELELNIDEYNISPKNDHSLKRSCFFMKREFTYSELNEAIHNDFLCEIKVNRKWKNLMEVFIDETILKHEIEENNVPFRDFYDNPSESNDLIHQFIPSTKEKILVIQTINNIDILKKSSNIVSKIFVSKGTQTENACEKENYPYHQEFLKPKGKEILEKMNKRKTTEIRRIRKSSEKKIINELSKVFLQQKKEIEGRGTNRRTFIPSPEFSPIKRFDLNKEIIYPKLKKTFNILEKNKINNIHFQILSQIGKVKKKHRIRQFDEINCSINKEQNPSFS